MAPYFDERKLVREAQAGSREAFETLLDACEDKVYNLVRRMVGEQDAEDVAQEALIEVCKSINRFKGNSSLYTWVYRVSMNVCLEHRRRKKPEFISFEDDFIEQEADPDENPEAAAIKGELKQDIDKALQALPDIHRDVVVLHELQGLTYQECADVLNCPVGTVKSRLSNAFIKLRQLLSPTYPTESVGFGNKQSDAITDADTIS